MKKNRYKWGIPLALALSLAGFIAGYAANHKPVKEPVVAVPQQPVDWSKLDRIHGYIKDFYNGPYQKNRMEDYAIKGMVGMLNQGGEYYTQSEYAAIKARRDMDYGTGIVWGVSQGYYLEVAQVYQGSAAAKAGIRAGDLLLKLNDATFTAKDLELVQNMMHSPRETSLKLELAASPFPRKLEIEMEPLVTKEPRVSLLDEIAYISPADFSPDAGEVLKDKILKAHQEGVKGFVLDLRDQYGGSVSEGVEIASLFIPKGEAVGSVEDIRGNRKNFLSDSGQLKDARLVILTNLRTQGVAELIAGSLKGKANIRIMGENSRGQGQLYSYIDLPKGEGIKLASGSLVLPGGQPIKDHPIPVDVLLPEYSDKIDLDSVFIGPDLSRIRQWILQSPGNSQSGT